MENLEKTVPFSFRAKMSLLAKAHMILVEKGGYRAKNRGELLAAWFEASVEEIWQRGRNTEMTEQEAFRYLNAVGLGFMENKQAMKMAQKLMGEEELRMEGSSTGGGGEDLIEMAQVAMEKFERDMEAQQKWKESAMERAREMGMVSEASLETAPVDVESAAPVVSVNPIEQGDKLKQIQKKEFEKQQKMKEKDDEENRKLAEAWKK